MTRRACFFFQATGGPTLAAVYPLTNFVDTEGVALLRGRAVVLAEERSGALVEVQTATAAAPAPAAPAAAAPAAAAAERGANFEVA